ncbi:MAG: hypothetical protein IJ476_00300 [Bacteroidales bacterium]|nr:hypothetical protein [Bacteroidales bacterium]
MENLEKYIQDNLEQFNCGEMPLGHQERFMAKLQAAQAAPERKAPRLFSRRSLFAATAAAAAIVIAFFITTGSPASDGDDYTIAIHEVAEEMYIEEAEIMIMLGEDDQNIVNSVKSITEEAIPLSEQLPAELSQEKRAQILREYYKTRTAALKNFRVLAHSNEIID